MPFIRRLSSLSLLMSSSEKLPRPAQPSAATANFQLSFPNGNSATVREDLNANALRSPNVTNDIVEETIVE